MRCISEVFIDFQKSLNTPTISVADMIKAMHERGFGFLLLVFATPMALPIPVPPGINILLASPLVLLTAQQALGREDVWLPRFIQSKSFSREKMEGMLEKIIPLMTKLEVLFKPRLEFVTTGIFSHFIGFLGLIMALTVCIPVPLTNTVPSLGIALMAVGVIMRDGLAVLTGAMIGIAWVTLITLTVIFLGVEGIDFIKDSIKSFM